MPDRDGAGSTDGVGSDRRTERVPRGGRPQTGTARSSLEADLTKAGVSQFVGEDRRVPAGLIYSTVVPVGISRLGRIARTGACRTRGRDSHMRFTKSVMAICAVCAAMLTMSSIRRMRMAGSKKRRGMLRSRHG